MTAAGRAGKAVRSHDPPRASRACRLEDGTIVQTARENPRLQWFTVEALDRT